jgi:hypothetical protein
VAALLLLLAVLAALAGCSGGGSDSSDAGGAVSSEAGADRDFSGAPAEGDQPTSAQDSAGRTASGAGSPSAPPRLDRAVIATGTVSLRGDDVGQVRRDVQRVVDAHRGSIAEENTDSDEEGQPQYARLVVRVPASQFDDAMSALEGIGELRASQRSAEDVTTQVIDNDVRVRAQTASLRRVEALLARADSLQQIIWIESQLTQRQADLDSLKSQQAWLSDQTTLSTITVDIERTAEPEKADAKDAGFLTGLRSGLDALEASASALATVVGALLPWAILAALLAVPARLLLRRNLRRRRPEPEATS